MPQNKTLFKVLLLGVSLLVTTSCNPYGFPTNSSDPEIIALIEFTNNFKLQTCLNTYKSAELTYLLEDNLNEGNGFENIGKHTVNFDFSMEEDGNYYSNHIEYLEGSLKSNDYPNLFKFERYINPIGDSKYDYITLHDGVEVEGQCEYDISQAAVYSKLYQFYANEGGIGDGAVNGGGLYYGDQALIDLNQYWKQFHVDLEKNVLVYEFNDISMDQYTKASVRYELNIHGMLLNYYQVITETKNSTVHQMECNMSVNYNI